MSQLLEIQMPEEVLLAMQKDAQSFAAEMRLAAAVKWYEMGTLSQGKAAEAAGLSRTAFISALARYGVSPFQESSPEIIQAVRDSSK